MAESEWAGALGQSPWVLVVLYAATAVDGIFPPAPSESVVIALAALPADTRSAAARSSARARSAADDERRR